MWKVLQHKNTIQVSKSHETAIDEYSHCYHEAGWKSGEVLMNWSNYFERGLSVIQSKQCTKLDYDPTSILENKVQRTLHKMKSRIAEKVQSKVYPTGESAPGEFYGNSKIHKLLSDDMNKLPLRPTELNIRTVS